MYTHTIPFYQTIQKSAANIGVQTLEHAHPKNKTFLSNLIVLPTQEHRYEFSNFTQPIVQTPKCPVILKTYYIYIF